MDDIKKYFKNRYNNNQYNEFFDKTKFTAVEVMNECEKLVVMKFYSYYGIKQEITTDYLRVIKSIEKCKRLYYRDYAINNLLS